MNKSTISYMTLESYCVPAVQWFDARSKVIDILYDTFMLLVKCVHRCIYV